MSMICEVCGKRPHAGRTIARRGLAKKKGGVGRNVTGVTIRRFLPNIQKVRAVVNGQKMRIRVCASCLTSGKVSK